jgi:acetyltransferase-like isoleucine patch superfamily enzyme
MDWAGRSTSAWRKGIVRAMSALSLRSADRVGSNAIVEGRPHISNAGTLVIGDDFRLCSRPAPSHLVVMPGGRIDVGDRVSVSYGAAISSQLEVRIGHDTRFGPFVVVMDSDFHVAGDRAAIALPAAVSIGNQVLVGSRVTILRGSTIGDAARVESGSVVSGNVPAGAVVAGVPARVMSGDAASDGTDLPDLVMRVLGLSRRPSLREGPADIPHWDSLGSLKLLLALEEAFGVSLAEEDLLSASSIARLDEIVEAARSRLRPIRPE